MDDVDYKYQDSIREALQSKNADKLMMLIPTLSESEAMNYIERWNMNYLEIMMKIRTGQDTSDFDIESYNILHELLDQVNLSGYHRGRKNHNI